ncbi:MAG: translation initiation factor IF-2 [Bacteroidota bacterium]|nr:translation initiation factor IF-2 [Bacteroidota bacterium]
MTESTGKRRLKQVAVEFNIGLATVVEYLGSKGIEVESSPNAKVSDEAYEKLLEKFQPDRQDKMKSEEMRQTSILHKEDKAHADEHHVEAPAPKEEKAQGKSETPKAEEKKVKEKPAVEEPEEKEEATFRLKVIGQINVDSLKSGKGKGKGKAAPKAKEKPAAEAKTPDPATEPVGAAPEETVEEKPKKGKAGAKTKDKEVTPEAGTAPAEVTAEAADDAPIDVSGVQEFAGEIAEKLHPQETEGTKEKKKGRGKESEDEPTKGLTILGKIDLGQFNKPAKKPVASTDNLDSIKKKRRKRRRIGEGGGTDAGTNPPGPGQQGGQFQRGPGQGPYQGQGQRPYQGGGGGNRPPYQGGGGNRPPYQGGGGNRPQQQPANPNMTPAEKAAMDEKRIQEQIKNTLNRLSRKNTGGGIAGKAKKKKRDINRQRVVDDATAAAESKLLQITEFITVNEIATLMNVAVTEVIMACMNMGLMVSINQRLDAETITVVADEFGYDVEFREAEMDEPSLEEPDNEAKVIQRPPIVTIMGHVDHGKTSLLDYIRSSNVVAGEAGGITQHIGAYEVTIANGKRITFLDTPGHEAFTAMRARGAKVTDIAIIVIAADDSVMPQTKEAISHAQAAGVPIVFAFNKMDKDGANAERVRQQLAEMNVLVEEWGGKYQTQEISAKKGLNVDTLLEKVIFEADILDLKADPAKRAIGTVIEASMDKGKGIVANILVEKGTLHVGDPILAGANYGRVKAMYNERGQRIKEAGPAAPVQVLGFDGAPTAGDKFYVTENEAVAKDTATKRRQLLREQGIRTKKHITLDEIGRRLAIGTFKELNLIIKGDVDGSVEALSDSLQKLSTGEVQVNVVHKGVGQISESDVLLASASDAIIIGFQVRPSIGARKLAENEQIDIRMYSIIYNAIEEVKAAMEGLLAPATEEKIVSNVEVREVYKITKVGAVAGCYVLDGKISRNNKIRLVRDGVVVYTGDLSSLKRFKDDVKEVAAGYECGLTIHNFNDMKVGDIIEAFEEVEVARKL